MTSTASVVKKIKVKDLPKIALDVYSMIALNNLVVYAVHYLQEHKVTATVEEIVSVCFRLFPQSFALKNYPRWPDSALVIRRLNDGREKGNIKGNSMDGFALKYRGQQLAKRVAKALGLAQPISTKAKRSRVVSQKKKVAELIARKKAPKKRLRKPVSQTIIAKQETLPLIKMRENPRKKSVKVSASTSVKKAPIRKKHQKQDTGKTKQSKQLTMAFPIFQEKKTKNLAAVTPKQVSKEEKAKAGKFVHSIERSDAYIHYKKNGRNSKVGEFDFRSLLLCTMESSRETLVQNMELFRGYASIHNRQDLLVFLSDCEDKFSYLLAAPQKQLKKPVRKSRK